jgi:hypothetical protein
MQFKNETIKSLPEPNWQKKPVEKRHKEEVSENLLL